MRALLVVFFAALMLASPAWAQPAAPQIEACQADLVSGTRWEGRASWHSGESKEWTLYFRGDGVLEYGYEGMTYDNGRWRQNGALITWHTNDYYAIFSGLVASNAMMGSSYNSGGDSGVFSFVRLDD